LNQRVKPTFWGEWGRRIWSFLGLSLLGMLSLYYGYKTTGADSLRTDIYLPLYSEIASVENLLGSDPLQPLPSGTYVSLQKSGAIERIPLSLKSTIADAYAQSFDVRSHALPVAIRIERLIPPYIQKIRSADDEGAWNERTVAQLNRETDLRAFGGFSAQFTMRHAGATPALDVRDPQAPRIGAPGFVSWTIDDWLAFPSRATDIYGAWTNLMYLEFDPKLETWQYRITQEDLVRNHLTLQEFLEPIYLELHDDPDFTQIAAKSSSALNAVRSAKAELAARIREPKRIADIWDH
jgi:hypothetical protein